MEMQNKTEDYKGFVISWVEPRLTAEAWHVSVASNDRRLQRLIGLSAPVVTDHNSLQGAIDRAKRQIDQALATAH